MPISNYCSVLQTVYEILTNIYETFAVRLTDCSTVIESCDVYAVVARLQFYHKEVQGPSSTGSLPLTEAPSNCVHFWLCIHMHFKTLNACLPPPAPGESDSCSYFCPRWTLTFIIIHFRQQSFLKFLVFVTHAINPLDY